MVGAEGKLVDFILEAELTDVPDAGREKVKKSLLDTLGAAVAGSGTAAGKITSSFALEEMGGDEATVFCHGRASAMGAALANGYMANALDVDDGGKYTRGHPGAQLVPATLALGEKYGATGRGLLLSLVIGYETAHRVGRCWHNTYEEYRSCGSWGSVACAAAGARLIGLTREETGHAVAIADYNSPYLPMKRALKTPTTVKHGTGAGALTGILALEWAARGFTGPETTLSEGECGQFFSNLGEDFVLAEPNAIEYKKMPSCSWGHPAINAALELMEKAGVSSDEIERVEVEGFSEMASLYRDLPETEEEAQFSVKWPLAAAIVDGEVCPENTSPPAFSDPEKRSAFDRIKVTESEKLDRLNRSVSRGEGETSAWPSRVKITTKKGEEYNSGVTMAEGDREVSFPELAEKFSRLTAPYLSDKSIQKVIQGVKRVEEMKGLGGLTKPLREKGGQ